MGSTEYVYNHGTVVNALSCYDDLVAVGGVHTLSVLQVDNAGWVEVASFSVGSPVVALAFSPVTVSPTSDRQNWRVQLAAACADGHIRRLTQSASADAAVELVSDGATTHHDVITALAFSGASGGRYLASVALDCTLLVWDLESVPSASYPTRFAHPLLSVAGHPKQTEFVVADDAGSVFLVDWADTGRAPVQLVDPRALADKRTGHGGMGKGTGGASWKPTDKDCVGATFGSRWVIWHLAHGAGGGGKPVLSGNGFLEGGHRFRWSPSDPNLFAISTLSPAQGATIQIFNTSFPGAAPSVIVLDRRPNRVHDFDFVAGLGLAVAVGRRVHFAPLSHETVPPGI